MEAGIYAEKIGFLVGSLRKGSYSKQIAQAVAKLLPQDYTPVFVDLSHLEIYNQDLDDDSMPTEAWKTFRKEIRQLDGIIFVTPEYNRSVPPLLKNALDVGSRPFGKNAWDNKPALVISVDPGAIGGFGANHHLRQSLVFVKVPTLQQPEAYICNVTNLLGEDGTVAKNTLYFLKTIINAYIDFFEKLTK